MKYSFFSISINAASITCLIVALLLVGCDSTTGTDIEGDVTFQGRVTEDPGFGKVSQAADVEGAIVTAANVTAGGSLEPLDGEATTNAEGEFNLEVENATQEVVLVAESESFTSKTMVYHRSQSTVETMPMTSESHAEADVFVEARAQEDSDALTMADVAIYVTEQGAADIRSGARSATDVAAAISAEAEAKIAYVRDAEDDDVADDVISEENDAFLALQDELAASADAEAEAEAIENFELALIEAFADAGVSFESQARARQAGLSAVVHLGDAGFEMRKQAEILASLAMAYAVEASFDAADASEEGLAALADARTALIAELRAATSESTISDAQDEYQSVVEAELSAEIEVDEAVIVNAVSSTTIDLARTALEASLTAAESADAVAEAHAVFFAAVQTAVENDLSESTSDASFAAEVLTLVSVS